MTIRILCFTKAGQMTAARLHQGLLAAGHESVCSAPASCLASSPLSASCSLPHGFSLLDLPVKEWTGRFFERGTGLIYIGAAGIAVRSIAPYLQGKDQDPAVVVVDEKGNYAISLLSGHLGGGNDLARLAASILGADPVITTATDLNGVFAVDLFAKANGLTITDLTAAKRISAALLRGEQVGFFSEFPVEGRVPAGLTVGRVQRENILLSVLEHPVCEDFGRHLPTENGPGHGLLLVPAAVIVGMGCKKNTAKETIREAFIKIRKNGGFHPASIAGIASIDLKKKEPGLLQLAKDLKLPLSFFTAEELQAISGDFTESEFVRQITGVSNVCERAAVCGCGPSGRLAVKKTTFDGVTAAAAVAGLSLRFDK